MVSRNGKDDIGDVVPVSRWALLLGYVAVAAILLLSEACIFFMEPLVGNGSLIFDPSIIPLSFLFAALICAGLCCATFLKPRAIPWLGGTIAYLTAAYSLAALAVAIVGSWEVFTSRVSGDRAPFFVRWAALERFFQAHTFLTPFGIGLWIGLTPFAALALIGLAPQMRRWIRLSADLTQRLALLILAIAAPSSAFVLGTMMAEVRSPQAMFDTVYYASLLVPVVVFGAFSAFIATWIFVSRSVRKHDAPPRDKLDFGKVLTSASQLSILTLLILYVSISQIAAYAKRISALIELRRAFAVDVLQAYATDNAAFPIVPSVPWAGVKITKFESDQIPGGRVLYRIEVQEDLTNAQWSVRTYRLENYKGSLTQEVADREGVAYTASDNPIGIYPKVEAQLRAKEVAFPGAGFSLDLTTFTLVAPLVIFATLVLLSERARTAVEHFSLPDEPWILLDGRTGLAGLLARLWLAAIAFGPWALAVVVVQAVSLLLRTKGDFETSPVDVLASVYIAIALVLLLVPTWSAIKRLLILRGLARLNRDE
jgi:hypothetical protein